MVGNWPLLAIRIGESILMVVIFIVSAIAIIVPFVTSLWTSRALPSDPGAAAEEILSALASHWLVFVYALVVVSIVLLVVIAVHSFVVSGNARVYVDGERKAGTVAMAGRGVFACFSGDRWFAGGRDGWWPVFWIYNIAWSVAGLILLVPMVVVLAAMILLRENAAAAFGIGCLGLIVTIVFTILVIIVTNIWTEKAIVDCLARSTGALESLSDSWAEFRSDMGRHLVVAIVMMVVAFAGSMAFSSFSWMGALSQQASPHVMLMPVQFTGSILNSILSAAVGSWFLACFAALAVESRV